MPKREAGFTWTDAAGQHAVELQYQLMDLRPRIRRSAWTVTAISGATHSAHDADAVCDVEGVIRFAAHQDTLLSALDARVGDSITYYEERAGELVEFSGILLSAGRGLDYVGLDPDAARYGAGEFMTTIVLRFDDLDLAQSLYGFTGE